jgi:hypothetical protein
MVVRLLEDGSSPITPAALAAAPRLDQAMELDSATNSWTITINLPSTAPPIAAAVVWCDKCSISTRDVVSMQLAATPTLSPSGPLLVLVIREAVLPAAPGEGPTLTLPGGHAGAAAEQEVASQRSLLRYGGNADKESVSSGGAVSEPFNPDDPLFGGAISSDPFIPPDDPMGEAVDGVTQPIALPYTTGNPEDNSATAIGNSDLRNEVMKELEEDLGLEQEVEEGGSPSAITAAAAVDAGNPACALTVGGTVTPFQACRPLEAIAPGFMLHYSSPRQAPDGTLTFPMALSGSADGYVSVGFPLVPRLMLQASAVALQACASCPTGNQAPFQPMEGMKGDGRGLAAPSACKVELFLANSCSTPFSAACYKGSGCPCFPFQRPPARPPPHHHIPHSRRCQGGGLLPGFQK